ncbi:MAG: hypothetical protein EBT15_09100 [Betaproteobacteria bacterium]|nr:hypothetical protein [Betaproteobacteria bacterium]
MGRGTRFDGILIAHLGNINGPRPDKENRLAYLQAALKAGWHVCAEVVFHQGSFLLPFDGGFNVAPPSFFSNQRVWSRCYDAETLDALCNVNAHAFLVNEAGPTLTSAQFIWTPSPRELAARSIAFLPEDAPGWVEQFEPAGLCSNCPARYI